VLAFAVAPEPLGHDVDLVSRDRHHLDSGSLREQVEVPNAFVPLARLQNDLRLEQRARRDRRRGGHRQRIEHERVLHFSGQGGDDGRGVDGHRRGNR